jgi:sugar O-acyltransferase (sialic acid O-acetyltransferase NeuD family)
MKSEASAGPIVIFGGRGAGAMAALTLARASSPASSPLAGFLNDFEAVGSLVEGTPILGSFATWPDQPETTCFLAPLHKAKEVRARSELIRGLGVPERRWVNVVDPAALVSADALVGSGIWVQAGSSIMPSARIGNHVAVRSGCQISHDCVVEDFASVGLGAILCGYSIVRQGAHIAPGAIIRDRITVGRYSVVGLGAVVVKDVPDGAIVVGNPARIVGGLGGNSN